MSNAGAMLRLARQLRGFSQSEAAECLRVPNAELSRIENGLKEPTEQLLTAAAELFSVPIEFFGQTDTIFGAPISVHAPMWRKKSNVSATELHGIVAELNVRVMHLRKLLEAIDLEPVNKLPRFDAEEYDNDAEKIAGLVRRFWQIPDGPIQDLTGLVEDAGILVAHSDLRGSSVSGVRFTVPGMPHLIVLNGAHSADRMRFTLCHELGHIIMHTFPTQNMEEEADTFASTFLVPTEDVKPYFAGRRVDLRLLAALKPEWKVSMGSLVFAAKRAGFLNETQAQYIWKQFNIHKIRLREPPELDFPVEEPRMLSDLISLHINEMGYSLADLAKVLMMNETEVAKTYSIDLPGQKKSRAGHLRVIQ
ncbi:XRE family transcriptional regulator [Bradyrhizobium diazoefficiens]|uniref:DNA-binding protein n=1 Tax=Bradyrhizobium diazoefficiens TaxID=1355477 RepID=A0A809ZV15_9BRAD|nr:XRE family transcriptional regulator [Bradyrhizobium diazoefficiens]BBZ94348.1 DNA-binding protein [Bradyrhizobium diazoefficiens]BCE56436.1 DNA-binding protein [Bradyrhizobium diazoefficiens]